MYADGTVIINQGFSIDSNGMKVYSPSTFSSGDVSVSVGTYYKGYTGTVDVVDQVWALGFRRIVKFAFVNGMFVGKGESVEAAGVDWPGKG